MDVAAEEEDEGETKLPRKPGALDGSTVMMLVRVSIVVADPDALVPDPLLVFPPPDILLLPDPLADPLIPVELKADPRAATVAKFNF